MAVAMAVARVVALATMGLMVLAVAVAVARAVAVMMAAVATTALDAALVGSGGRGGSIAEVGDGSGCK